MVDNEEPRVGTVFKDPIVLDREGNEIFVPAGEKKQEQPFHSGIRVVKLGPITGLLLLLALPVLLFFGVTVVLGLLLLFAVVRILMRLFRT